MSLIVTAWFLLVGIFAGVGAGAIIQWLDLRTEWAGPHFPSHWLKRALPAAVLLPIGVWWVTIAIPAPGEANLFFMGAAVIGLGIGLHVTKEVALQVSAHTWSAAARSVKQQRSTDLDSLA